MARAHGQHAVGAVGFVLQLGADDLAGFVAARAPRRAGQKYSLPPLAVRRE